EAGVTVVVPRRLAIHTEVGAFRDVAAIVVLQAESSKPEVARGGLTVRGEVGLLDGVSARIVLPGRVRNEALGPGLELAVEPEAGVRNRQAGLVALETSAERAIAPRLRLAVAVAVAHFLLEALLRPGDVNVSGPGTGAAQGGATLTQKMGRLLVGGSHS